MNDILRKLALQADVWCDQNCMDHPFYNVQWEQKFAELIVRECARKIESDYKYVLGTDTKWNTAFDIACSLPEHFGVEE